MKLKWERGPLGYQTSEDWKYWVPKSNIPGKWTAIYFPTGLPTTSETISNNLDSEEVAKEVCNNHYLGRL